MRDYAAIEAQGGSMSPCIPLAGVRGSAAGSLDVVMRREHRVAEKMFVGGRPDRRYPLSRDGRDEAGVLLVERWILARLHHHTFFTLAELNREIRRLLEVLKRLQVSGSLPV